MFTRRRFLSLLGALSAGAPLALAEERQRGRWGMIFGGGPVEAAPFRPEPETWNSSTLTASWIGHATVLINFFGMHIITDPVFSERVGLNVADLFTLGPKRLVAPALKIEELPPIDLIVLSHAHMDHLDISSLEQFDRSIPVVMAKHTSDVIVDLEFATVYELDWGQWTQVGPLRIEAVEAKHFGWRYPWETDRSRGNPDGRSYNSYLFSLHGRHVLFGGDTAYHDKYRALKERGIAIDVAMLPIGAYDPWVRAHATPEQALAMADQMGAARIMPIHWHTFIQSEEPVMEPIERLRAAAADRPGVVVLDSIGQTWSLSGTRAITGEPVSGDNSSSSREY